MTRRGPVPLVPTSSEGMTATQLSERAVRTVRSERPPERRPARVLFLTGCTGRGGAGHSLLYLLQYLDRDGIEPVVVMPSAGVIGKKLRALKIRTILSPRLRERFHELRFARKTPVTVGLSYVRNTWDGLVFLRQLVRIIKRDRIDLIYCNHMMVKVMGILAGLATQRPVILHCRTIYRNPIVRFAFNLLASLPHVRRIVAVSHASAANFNRVRHKVHVIPNGVPVPHEHGVSATPTLRRRFDIKPTTPVVGFIGRIVNWKGIGVFLQAAEETLSARRDVVFVIVGDSPIGTGSRTVEEYRDRVRRKGLEKHVLFAGFTEDIGSYLRDITVLVVPSIHPDPCPRAVIEAMAFGIPIIGSAIGGIPETIQHESTGLLVEPGNVSEVHTQILRVLEDQELRARLGSQAKQVAARRFGAHRVSRRIQRLIVEETRNRELSVT